MKTLFWEILARLGFRIPIAKYKPNRKYWDWVLVDLREKTTGIFFIPKVAEYCSVTDSWYFESDDDTKFRARFFAEQCDFVYWHKLPKSLNRVK